MVDQDAILIAKLFSIGDVHNLLYHVLLCVEMEIGIISLLELVVHIMKTVMMEIQQAQMAVPHHAHGNLGIGD